MADQGDPSSPGPYKGHFSFVNKDAGNLHQKDHNATVLWHVQHRYEKWKKEERSRKVRDSASPVPTTRQPAGESERVSFDAPFLQLQVLNQISQGRQNVTAAGPAATETSSENPLQLSQTSTQSLAAKALSQNGAEADEDTRLITKLIALTCQDFIKSNWPSEGSVNPPSWELAQVWNDVTATALDDCYANAFFAVIAALVARDPGEEAMLQKSQVFQAKAMTILRSRTQNEPEMQTPLTIRAILFLFTSETLVDNAAGARVHLRMLRHLVSQGAGVASLDPWLKENILSCDAYFALKYETRPQFPATEWSPGPLSSGWKNRIAARRGRTVRAPDIDSSVENRKVRDVIRDLRELAEAQVYVLSTQLPPDEPILRWIQLRKYDCVSRLASLAVDIVLMPHLFGVPAIESCICTVASLWMALVFGSPEPLSFQRRLLLKLNQKLESTTVPLPANLKVWALYVGKTAAETTSPGCQVHEWFNRNFNGVTQAEKLDREDKLIAVLRRFLFSEKIHQEIKNGRRRREKDVLTGVFIASGCSWRAPLEDFSGPPVESSDDSEGPAGAKSDGSQAKGKERAR